MSTLSSPSWIKCPPLVLPISPDGTYTVLLFSYSFWAAKVRKLRRSSFEQQKPWEFKISVNDFFRKIWYNCKVKPKWKGGIIESLLFRLDQYIKLSEIYRVRRNKDLWFLSSTGVRVETKFHQLSNILIFSMYLEQIVFTVAMKLLAQESTYRFEEFALFLYVQ